MNYQKEKITKGQLKIRVELEIAEFDRIFTVVNKKTAQETSLPGFRLGAAPLDLVEREVGQEKILEKTAKEAIAQTLETIVLKERLSFIGQPRIEILKLARGNPFIFAAVFVLWPKVELGNAKKIKIEPRIISISKERVDQALKELQEIHRQEVLVQRPVQIGDRLEVDLEIFLDGLPLEEGKLNNASFSLDQDRYLPGFLENVLGLSSSETKTFFLYYPEAHFDKKLAGKKVEFRVKINNVYEVRRPALNDDLAKKVGPFNNLNQLKAEIENSLKRELERKEEERIEIAILKSLMASSNFEEIPEILIQEEKEKMFFELEVSLEQMKLNLTNYLHQIKKTKDDLDKEFTPKAEERVKVILLIKEVANREKIIVEENEIETEIERQKTLHQEKPEILKNLNSQDYKNYLYNLLLNRKALNWLKKQITIN